MKNYVPIICSLLAFAAAPCGASVVVSISPTPVDAGPGASGAFDVVLTNTGSSASSINVGSFSFEVTVAGTGVTFTGADFSTVADPYIFAGESFDVDNGLPLYFSSVPSQTLDAADSSDSTGTTLAPGTSYSLGLVQFSVASNAAFGAYGITFTGGNGLANSLTDPSGTPIAIDSLNGGSVDVVPEPASALMTLAGAAIFALIRGKKVRCQ